MNVPKDHVSGFLLVNVALLMLKIPFAVNIAPPFSPSIFLNIESLIFTSLFAASIASPVSAILF